MPLFFNRLHYLQRGLPFGCGCGADEDGTDLQGLLAASSKLHVSFRIRVLSKGDWSIRNEGVKGQWTVFANARRVEKEFVSLARDRQ